MRKQLNNKRGITLIALVVTIIVLLILVTISVVALIREDGILKATGNAKIGTEKYDIKEQLDLAVIESEMNGSNHSKVDIDILQEKLNKLKDGNFIDSYSPDSNFSLPVTVKKGKYQFLIDEEGKVTEITDNNIEEEDKIWKEAKADTQWYTYGGDDVNAPILKGNMKAVVYTGEDLSNETNLWANAMTSDGSMWVWIPRFAYKIKSGYVETKKYESESYGSDNEEVDGTIEIKFIDTENKFLDGTSGTIKTDPSEITYKNGAQNQWLVHPAFTSNVENGGWDTELSGIWVGKFEATGSYDPTTGEGTLSVKPATQSLRNLKVNDEFKLAKASTFGEKISAEELGSHMAKNSEWGAVAYLTLSKYGINGNTVEKNMNSLFYTGGSDTEETIYTSNKNQSTTGNATGVYDMNGGSWEAVAGYVNFRNGHTSSTYKDYYTKNNDGNCYLVESGGGKSEDLFGGSQEVRTTSTKYKTVYASDGESNTNSMIRSYLANNLKKGDAMYETSSGTGKTKSGANTTNSWFKELSIYCNYGHPFFKRGGSYSKEDTGIFYFNNSSGGADIEGSFRSVLAF